MMCEYFSQVCLVTFPEWSDHLIFQAYGKANHATTAILLEECFAAYSITWSD